MILSNCGGDKSSSKRKRKIQLPEAQDIAVHQLMSFDAYPIYMSSVLTVRVFYEIGIRMRHNPRVVFG